MFTGYAGWVAGVKDWLSVDEFTDTQINVFLSLATARLNTDLRAYYMEKAVDYTVLVADVTNGYITVTDVATDFNGVRQITVDGTETEVLSINEYRKKVSQTADYRSDMFYYCIDAGRLYFYPAVSEDATIALDYWEKVPNLSGSVDANTFSTNYPNILLIAASLEAAPYLEDDERVPMWQTNYETLVTRENGDLGRKKMGSTPLKRNISTLS